MHEIDSIIPFPGAVTAHANENDHRDDRKQLKNSIGRHATEVNVVMRPMLRDMPCVDRNGLLESSLNDVTSVTAGTSSHAAWTKVTCCRCIYIQTRRCLFLFLSTRGWRSFQDYVDGIIMCRCLDSYVKMLTPLLLIRRYNALYLDGITETTRNCDGGRVSLCFM